MKSSLRNIKLLLEYDGTNYIGWEKQGKGKSIRAVLEATLFKILNETVKVIPAGRTDAGVHAKGQVVNFKTHKGIGVEELRRALNALLPSDIRIKSAREVDLDFHARYSAKRKLYKYFLYTGKVVSPFLYRYVWHLPQGLNLELMAKEMQALIGEHDFKPFQATGSSVRDTVRTVYKASVKKKGNLFTFEVEANGFLYKMMRLIVGTVVEVGRGRFEAGKVKRLLSGQDFKRGPTAPAGGLFLWRVIY